MILHLVLLALAVFCVYETLRPVLPYNLPDAFVALGLFGLAVAGDTYLTDRWLGLLATVAAVGVLHQKFGATGTGGWALRWPVRKGQKIPLP